MRRPSATKALKTLSLMITIWMFCFSRPAARRIGREYSRSNCSASVSRRTGGPLCCASAGTGAATRAAAAITAVSFEALLRGAMRSGMKGFFGRSLVIGGGRNRIYALTNTSPNKPESASLGQGSDADIDAGCDTKRPCQGPVTASARAMSPFMVMDVMAAAARIEAAGGHVIHMEVGQPAASAPRAALSAAHAALDGGRLDYTSALGMPSLRQRISRHYRDIYGCAVDAERIVVTTGSSGAFVLAFLRCSNRATGSRSRCPVIRRIATS